MDTVTLKAFHHRGMECIGIYAPFNGLSGGESLNSYFQRHASACWSRSWQCWYIPCTRANYAMLTKALKGKANLNVTELRKYLAEKKSKESMSSQVQNKEALEVERPKADSLSLQQKNVNTTPNRKLSDENNESLQKFKQQLVLKSYSPSTIKTYTNEFSQFLQTLGSVPASQLSAGRIKDKKKKEEAEIIEEMPGDILPF